MTPQSRKDIELLRSGLRAVRAVPLFRKLKAFALPFFSDAVIARLSSLRPQLRELRCALHSGKRAITAACSESSCAGTAARECAPPFYGSLRAVNVLLVWLRSTLTVLPPPMKRLLSIPRGKLSQL